MAKPFVTFRYPSGRQATPRPGSRFPRALGPPAPKPAARPLAASARPSAASFPGLAACSPAPSHSADTPFCTSYSARRELTLSVRARSRRATICRLFLGNARTAAGAHFARFRAQDPPAPPPMSASVTSRFSGLGRHREIRASCGCARGARAIHPPPAPAPAFFDRFPGLLRVAFSPPSAP
jgi:hypothetical protein